MWFDLFIKLEAFMQKVTDTRMDKKNIIHIVLEVPIYLFDAVYNKMQFNANGFKCKNDNNDTLWCKTYFHIFYILSLILIMEKPDILNKSL